MKNGESENLIIYQHVINESVQREETLGES